MIDSYIGVDIGGTSIKVGLMEQGVLVKTEFADTCGDKGGKVTLDILKNLIAKITTPSVKAIGIGVPSVVNREEGIVYNVHNIKNWDEVPLKKIIEEQFNVPVYVDNDANCFAIGERVFGNGEKYGNFVGITLGTGVGGGIIQGGRLLLDANCGSGEFGELPYLDSILEDYCGSRFFTERNNITGRDAYTLALQKDPEALKIFEEYGKHIASLVKIIILTIDPQAIILGGSIAKSFDLFEPAMKEEMKNFLFGRSAAAISVECSELENPAILGAAALCV